MPSNEGAALIHRLSVKRALRIPKYSFLCAAGFILLTDPSNIVVDQVSRPVSIAWALCMSLAALICLWGTVTDKWIGEFTGLPLLGGVLAFYGFAGLLSGRERDSLTVIAFGLIVLAFGLGAIARWSELIEVKNAHEVPEGEGGASRGDR